MSTRSTAAPPVKERAIELTDDGEGEDHESTATNAVVPELSPEDRFVGLGSVDGERYLDGELVTLEVGEGGDRAGGGEVPARRGDRGDGS